MEIFKPRRFSILPPVVKNLLIINGLFFLATITLSNSINLYNELGLHYWKSPHFETWQIISHMFMHGGIEHLFFNMFAVWMFGSQLENLWGSKRFFNYYILTGLGAAFLHFLVVHFQIDSFDSENYINLIVNEGAEILKDNRNYKDETLNTFNKLYNGPVVGASGALFGLLLAFGMLFPNAQLFFLFFPFPIKAKYFVIIYGLIELYFGLQNNPGDNVAHFAHLGGMVFGFLIIKYWKMKRNL